MAKKIKTKKADDGKPKNKGGRPRTGLTVQIPSRFKGQEPKVEFHPGAAKSVVREEDLPPPSDDAAKHKYPPPKKHPVFRETWMKYVDSITRREGFIIGHLETLRILCDLHVEDNDLTEWIRENGRSYCAVGRQGETWKLYPEVGLQKQVKSQIKEYIKLLKLVPKTDSGGEAGSEGDSWA